MSKFLTEYLGSFFLMLVILTSGEALAIGAILMVMVFAGGHISGAHYNPAVTLAVWIRGRITPGDAIGYMMVQVAGALTAMLVHRLIFLDIEMPAAISFENVPALIVAEVIGTLALAYVVLNVATAKRNAGNHFYGLAIGFTVFACAEALGKFSGGAFNPAVAIGAAAAGIFEWADLWKYLLGCFGGAALAALLFRISNPEDR